MATKLLVDASIEAGKKLLQTLDRNGFPVNAALWFSRDGTWKFVIASRVVNTQGPKVAYDQINGYLRSEKIDLSLFDISVVGSNDPLVRTLRPKIGTDPHAIADMRFTEDSINRMYIEDAYIYRVA